MKAVFTGSFNPFTKGHDDIVRRALGFCDQLVIGVGFNIAKEGDGNGARLRACLINDLYADNPRVEATTYEGLTADFARQQDADVIIRGVRTFKDYEYEREQAHFNRKLSGGLETILLFADPQYEAVSSSVVRELWYFGRDVSDLLPAGYDAKKILMSLPRIDNNNI